ncbi:hypothetical protein WAI453_011812 [Rhynchosporium graminicola]
MKLWRGLALTFKDTEQKGNMFHDLWAPIINIWHSTLLSLGLESSSSLSASILGLVSILPSPIVLIIFSNIIKKELPTYKLESVGPDAQRYQPPGGS